MKKIALLLIITSAITYASNYSVENFDSRMEFSEKELVDLVLYQDGDYRDSVWYSTVGDDGIDCRTEFHSFKISKLNSITDFIVTFEASQEFYPHGCGLPSKCISRVQKINSYKVETSCKYTF